MLSLLSVCVVTLILHGLDALLAFHLDAQASHQKSDPYFIPCCCYEYMDKIVFTQCSVVKELLHCQCIADNR